MPVTTVPVLWDLEVSAESSLNYEIGFGGITMNGTTSSRMRLRCELDADLRARNEKADSGAESTGDLHIGEHAAGHGNATPGGDGTRVERVAVSRRWECRLPGYVLKDVPAPDQPEQTFKLDLRVSVPFRTEIHVNFMGAPSPPPQEHVTSMGVPYAFAYDPSRAEPHQAQGVDLSDYLTELVKTAPLPGKLGEVRGTISYRLAKRKLELRYGETKLDVSALKYRDNRAVDRHVSTSDPGGNSWMVHSNMAGQVLVDGRNHVSIDLRGNDFEHRVRSPFRIWRIARSWELREDGKPLRDVSTRGAEGGDSPLLDRGWIRDHSEPTEDWIDSASIGNALPPPSRWTPKGVLDEFLVGVENFPEFGFVHAGFALEIRKNAYRIGYAASRKVSVEEAEKIYRSTAPGISYPFRDRNSGWTRVP